MPTFSSNTQTTQSLPSTFFQYQQGRQPGPTNTYRPRGSVTTTQRPPTDEATAGGPGGYQTSNPYQPGGISRPDGRPTPGETQPPPPPPAPTVVNQSNEAQYGVPQEAAARNTFYAQLNSGTPVEGMPGATWQHNGQGWTIVQGGQQNAPGATPGSTPATVPGMEYFNRLSGYTPSNVQLNMPEMYAGYTPSQLSVMMPEMFSGYQRTDFSGLKGPENYAGYTQYNYNTQLPTEGYKAGNLGTNAFTQYGFDPTRISQFNAPDQSMLEGKMGNLMGFLLDNPTSMSPQVVAALKEKQKETSMALQENQLAQNAEAAAARGIFGGGTQAAQDAAIRNQMNRDILSGYRDIDIQKATQDFADRQAVASLGDAIMTGQMGRATDAYNALLRGQTERETGFRESAKSAQTAEELALRRAYEQEQLGIAEDTSAQNLAKLGLSKEELMAQEGSRAFDARSAQFRDYLARSEFDKSLLDSTSQENLRQYQSGRDIFNAGMDQSRLGFDVDRANTDEQYRQWLSNASMYKDALSGMGMELDAARMNQANDQFGATYGFNLANAQAGLAESAATRDLQRYLAERGFGIDERRIASNMDIARMGDQTSRYGINTNAGLDMMRMALQNSQFGRSLGQNQSQFDATMGFNRQGQADAFFRWLIDSGGY